MRFHVRLKFLLVIIPFLLISLMSQNVSAASLSQVNFLKYSRAINSSSFSEVIRINSATNLPAFFINENNTNDYQYVNYWVMQANLPNGGSGKYFTLTVNYEVVAQSYDNTFSPMACSGLSSYAYPEQGTITSSNSWTECEVSGNGRILNVTTITYGAFSSETSVSSFYSLVSNYDNYLFGCSNVPGSIYSPCRLQNINLNSVNVNLSINQDPLVEGQNTIINQNNTIINQNQEMLDKENDAIDNIDNQSSSDISDAENQATTNLIGVLSNFFIQLQNFQATNCNLDLPFPQFIGGTQTVNICQGKDVLGNFITVIGTLAMVGFYIPLAWVLLKMIYNEIRSFTNG